MGKIKDFLVKNKIMRSETEISDYEITCQKCKIKFPKEKLKGAMPI